MILFYLRHSEQIIHINDTCVYTGSGEDSYEKNEAMRRFKESEIFIYRLITVSDTVSSGPPFTAVAVQANIGKFNKKI